MTTILDLDVDQHGWREASVWYDSWQIAEHVAVHTLGPQLADLETAETISLWWFIRKGVEWRIRYLPAPSRENDAAEAIGSTLNDLATTHVCAQWAHTIYEPPIAAFGGPQALASAYTLFHADSRRVLDHLGGGGHQRELGLLLIVALLRGARRDWYDQGQVWTLLTEERTVPAESVTPEQVATVKQLLTGDPEIASAGLGVPATWFTAFKQGGQRHFDLDRHGVPTRGLNAVLAHHTLYAWNRLGLPEQVQGALAAAAADAVFGSNPVQPHAANSKRASKGMSNVVVVIPDTTSLSLDPAQLRDDLADRILGRGTFRSAAVERASRAVPREIFLDGVDLAEAYRTGAVVTKRADDGTALSSASDPNLVATMAEDLDVRPGHTILEIGAATGINAAILAEIAGPEGHVTTIEIDQDLTEGAIAALARTGYSTVTAVCGDGAAGWAAAAPYDRIVVTAGAWDISTAWWDQLVPGGRIVIPLRLHGSGLTRSIAFDLQPSGWLTSSHTRVCGFVPMRGAAAHATGSIPLTEHVVLNIDTTDGADQAVLAQALTHPADTQWTGINFTDHEPVEHLDLWLATHTGGFSRLSVGAAARSAGVADPALRWAGASLHDGGTLAYIAARPHGPVSKEIGIVAHGPDSHRLTARFVELLQDWNHTRPVRPVITAHRAGTPDDRLGTGTRIERPDTRLTITW